MNKNDSVAGARSNELVELYPREPEVQYFLAAKQWKLKNKVLALQHLDSAINLAEKGVVFAFLRST